MPAMQQLDLTDPTQVCFHRAAELPSGPQGGVVPQRFPAAVVDALDAPMRPIARHSTGVEIQVRARHVTDLRLSLRLLGSDGYGVWGECFCGGGKLLPTWRLDPGTDEVQVIRMDEKPPAAPTDPIRIILPTHCEVEILALEVNADAEIEPFHTPYDSNSMTSDRPLTWVVHGDSIVQGANVTCPTATWVEFTAFALHLNPINLGIGGYAKAELALADYLATRTDADILSLNLGVNAVGADTEASFGERFAQFLARLRAGLPQVPLVITSPAWSYRDRETGDKRPQDIRNAMRRVCARRTAEGDTHLLLIDGLRLGFCPRTLRTDELHLSEAGSFQYANHMVAILRPLVRQLRP